MTPNMTIEQILVTDVTTVAPDAEIGQAARLLMERGVTGAPVVDAAGALVGILTTKDCFKAALSAAYYDQWGGTVERYMSPGPETLDISLDIVSAAERFIATSYHLYPVTKDGRMVGLIGRSDLLAAFLGAKSS